MSRMGIWSAMGIGFLALATCAHAQMNQKPGLWEVTTQMNMSGAGAPQMPQLPPGVQLPPGIRMPSPYAPHTTQVCVTQAMIDKYGGPTSAPPNGNCKVTDVAMKPDGMAANIVCTGTMNTTGTVQSTWTPDGSTTKTTIHMTGTMQVGRNNGPIDMTINAASTYKGPDCGNVKPMTMPAGQ